jgi:hypothetical protein
MSIDFKPNFFTGSAANPAPVPQVQMLQIAFSNDPKFRADFGGWLYDNFSELAREYKTYGRFLPLSELNNPLE